MMLQFEQLLGRALGLDASSIGTAAIQRSVQARMTARSVRRVDDYWALVQHDQQELQELIEHVVVSETWFFRHPEAFTVLSEVVRDQWLPSHPGGTLRVLSVPCATGEEPYTVAITLSEMGFPRSHVQIDAVDISQRVLTLAERGIYSANSFRGEAARVRTQYCTPTAPNRFELSPAIREWVTFQLGNIVVPEFKPRAETYDFIFCRNLLIYLDAAAQKAALTRLHALLAPEGILFVGPAEVTLASLHDFAAAGYPMAFACRKATARQARDIVTTSHVPRLVSPVVKPAAATPPRTVVKIPSAPAAPKVVSPPGHAVVPGNNTPIGGGRASDATAFGQAQLLANAGRLTEAIEMCQRVIRDEGPNADVVYLLAVVHDALNQPELAHEYYRKTLFLDPGHAGALLQLSVIVGQSGNQVGAQQLRDRARRVERESSPSSTQSSSSRS